MRFIQDYKKMPYHIRKRILNRIYTVIMYTILAAVLFPILWMFYNSFMGNTDIVQGKLFFQHAPHNVLLAEQTDKSMVVGTSDGAINILNKDTKKVINRKAFNTNNTDIIATEHWYWLSSADKGIIRVDRNKLQAVKRFTVNWNAQFDFNKISRTYLLADEATNKLWLTLGYQDYDRILEYSMDTMRLTKAYTIRDSFPYSYEKLAIANIYKVDKFLFVGTNHGIAQINTLDGTIKTIENTDFAVAEPRYFAYNAAQQILYIASMSKVYTYSLQTRTLTTIYSTIRSDGFEQITTLAFANNQLYLGTGHGIITITTAGQLVKEYFEPMFDDITEKGILVGPGKHVAAELTKIVPQPDGNLLLGSSGGRVSLYQPKDNLFKTWLVAKQGFYKVHWRNYIDLFHNIDFALYLRNSFIVCGLTAIFAMLIATITAYALVRFDFPGKNLISTSILSTQMIPGVMTLIPVYIMFIKFTEFTGIPVKGTFWGMIFVYSAFFLPFSVWILRGFFASIPIALEEAATIDGCTPLQIFWRIAIPLSIPGIIATGIFIFLVAWDELIFAWVLSNANTMTIPVGIRLFVGNFQNRYDLLMAASTVSTVPVMILFALLQKQIVSGLTSGAVKD